MRDALGGTVTLFIISVFIVLALGYLAFNVNYTKAFRMKDKIVSIYEAHEGCINNPGQCENEIHEYAEKIGYKPDNFNCSAGLSEKSVKGTVLYCVAPMDASGKTSTQKQIEQNNGYVDDKNTKCYYKIETKVNISIPVIDNLLNIDVFKVKGDSKAIEMSSPGVNCK